MFFFIYSEIGELEHNVIVKSAFEKMMFEKLQSEGYCDINPLIGRPRTSKSEIENNLKKLDSPLVKVFAGKYATNTEELEKIMLPVLKELEEKLSKNKSSFDEYNYFAIIYFIFQMYKSVDKKERLRNFENQERQAESERREKKIREEKLKRIYQSVDYAQETISRQNPAGGRLLKKKMHAVKSMERRFEKENENMTEMPEQEGAIFFKLGNKEAAIPAGKTVIEYELPELWTPDGERILAENIFLRIRGSEKICITGKNGVGKTTLLHKIAEELLNRNDIHAEYMPQNYEELLQLHVTPVEYLDQTGKKEERTKIRTFLGALKYTADEMDHPIAELSGGQKAKIFLLKMSMSGANVLILDEPTRNFSPLSGPVIREMLKEFPGAVISISHDRKYIDEVCDKVYCLTETGLQLQEK